MEFISRTGSGMGGHPMSERSYSHKSLGGQSSAGQSVHSATSGRANSFTSNTADAPGLAPGLFLLGAVPAIIRCWLTTTFKHDTMLYAAVCSGSYASYLDSRLIEKLGYQDEITKFDDNRRTITLPMYLPEAVPVAASSHASNPAPQLPSLSVEFTVVENNSNEADGNVIQIFLGSDMLRAHNADILLSSNQLTLYDDDQSKLRIPLVRPENELTFKSLYITSGSRSQPTAEKPSIVDDQAALAKQPGDTSAEASSRENFSKIAGTSTTSGSENGSIGRRSLEQRPRLALSMTRADSKDAQEPDTPSNTGRAGSSAVWSTGSWRRHTDKPGSADWANVGKTSASVPTYQRRDTGIKVLKKPGTRTPSTSVTQDSSPSTTGHSRFFDDGKRREEALGHSEGEQPPPPFKRSVSGEKAKENAPVLAKTRSANPIGGASAFPWLGGGSK